MNTIEPTQLPLPAEKDTQRQLREVFEDIEGFGLSPADVDALAEQYSEGRTYQHQHQNFHE